MTHYAKLFSTLTESSLWSGSKEARILFISMLARADGTGFVEAALSGLARMSNLTRQETVAALAELSAPDDESKCKMHEGRRIVEVPRGWCIVSYEEHRARRDEEERRRYMREYMRQYRKSPQSGDSSQNVNHGKPRLAQGEGEGEADGEREREAEKTLARSEEQTTEQPTAKTDSKAEKQRQALVQLGAKMIDPKGEDLLPEWLAVTKGLRLAVIQEVFGSASPGVQWPSEFKSARASRATY